MIFDTGKTKLELVAKSKAYRELKNALGCESLKMTFVKGYNNINVDLIAEMLKCFGGLKTLDEAFDLMDEALENGKNFSVMYDDLAQFAFDMGFFGRIPLGAGDTIQSWLASPFSAIDLNSAIEEAMDKMVGEQAYEAISGK